MTVENTEKPTLVSGLIETQTQEIMQSDEVKQLGNMAAKAKVKTEFESEAAELKGKQIDNAEKEFDNELREMRLAHRRAEEAREHKYRMAQIEKDGKHKAMLDKRQKLIEKYGYLYKTGEDGKPIDFSYSPVVNWLRTQARNFDRLDKPFKSFLKLVVTCGFIFGALVLLKHFGIIN